ncbi:protein affecting phage T7 exclusion by the F plasmid [Salinisphaera dokdonensis CL-ES53]|uniref:Protein affecting phage T7 exclusion by the F plasmid n=1 Tax=Salinisphaera dokdonensis CL-ES53 TaxID=1304272 RepID=A0ABV2AXT1_9GAMM
MAARLLILFIALPILELYLLIKIGGAIGFFPTIALVLLTAVIGSQLVRRQGLTVLSRIRESQARGEMPALPMLDGAALLLAGFMLLTPGFLSDALGFVLLVPGLRQKIARRLLSRVVIMQPAGGANERYAGRGQHSRPNPNAVIEGDYERGKSGDGQRDPASPNADDNSERTGRNDGA